MKLEHVLRKECVGAGLSLSDKSEVLVEIARLAKQCEVLKDLSEEAILEGLQCREQLGSTGFGGGIAIPHCRLEGVQDFVVGVLTISDGVDFDAIDGQKVRLVVFIVAPTARADSHVRLLSAISQNLLQSGIVNEMLQADDPENVYQSFLQKAQVQLAAAEKPERNLFHVFVQDENVFKLVLQALAGVETASAAVMETENISAYLSKMPLFADVWSDEPGRFSKLIVMAVEKGLTNEAIRRVEAITGDLEKCEGVMVIVQPVIFASGSLSGQF